MSQQSPEILYLIVGRGGSKGLPGKNLRQIGGHSLVAFKAIAARASRSCTRLVVSSDSVEIQEEARRHSAEVLFTRPAELANDTASSSDVVLHAMEWIERHEGRSYDAVMLLEPSSPFARPQDFDAAVSLYVERQAELIVGVKEVEVNSIFVGPIGANGSIAAIVGKMLGASGGLRRQDLPVEVTMNGALYLMGWQALKSSRRIYANPAKTFGLIMPRAQSVEIENATDFAFAQYAFDNNLVDRVVWS
ncbi:MAG: acylneuraminate cytidylyltransferase family protein [Hyphomicrobium sp.]